MHLLENGCIPGRPSVLRPDRRTAITGMVASIACALTHASSGEDRPRPIDAEQDPLERFGLDPKFRQLLIESGCEKQWISVCNSFEAIRMTPGERFEKPITFQEVPLVTDLLALLPEAQRDSFHIRPRENNALLTYVDRKPHIVASITCDRGKIDVMLRCVHRLKPEVVVNGKDEVVERRILNTKYHSITFGIELVGRDGKPLACTTANPNGIATFDIARFQGAEPFSIRFCPTSEIRPSAPEKSSPYYHSFSTGELNS